MGPLYPIYLYLYLYLQLYYLYLSSIFISTFWNWIIQSFNFMSVSARAWHVLRGLRVRLHQENHTSEVAELHRLCAQAKEQLLRGTLDVGPGSSTDHCRHISRVGWISWIKSSRVKGNHPSTFEGHTSSWGTTWTAASRAAMSWWRSWPTSASFREKLYMLRGHHDCRQIAPHVGVLWGGLSPLQPKTLEVIYRCLEPFTPLRSGQRARFLCFRWHLAGVATLGTDQRVASTAGGARGRVANWPAVVRSYGLPGLGAQRPGVVLHFWPGCFRGILWNKSYWAHGAWDATLSAWLWVFLPTAAGERFHMR